MERDERMRVYGELKRETGWKVKDGWLLGVGPSASEARQDFRRMDWTGVKKVVGEVPNRINQDQSSIINQSQSSHRQSHRALRAVLCLSLQCFALLCLAMPCYALLCPALLCFALLCYALLRFATALLQLCFAVDRQYERRYD